MEQYENSRKGLFGGLWKTPPERPDTSVPLELQKDYNKFADSAAQIARFSSEALAYNRMRQAREQEAQQKARAHQLDLERINQLRDARIAARERVAKARAALEGKDRAAAANATAAAAAAAAAATTAAGVAAAVAEQVGTPEEKLQLKRNRLAPLCSSSAASAQRRDQVLQHGSDPTVPTVDEVFQVEHF